MMGGSSAGSMPSSAPTGGQPSMGSALGAMKGGGGGIGKQIMGSAIGTHMNAGLKDMSETPNGQALFQMFTQLAQQQPNWNKQFAQPNEYVRALLQRGL